MSAVTIEQGSRVTLHFALKMLDGEVIDSNFDSQPATFVMGDGNLLPGFETPLLGMSSGEQQCVTVTAENAFGLPVEDNVQIFPVSAVKTALGDTAIEPGLMLSFTDAASGELTGVIRRCEDKNVVVDFNHPLAGFDIVFEVDVIEVENP